MQILHQSWGLGASKICGLRALLTPDVVSQDRVLSHHAGGHRGQVFIKSADSWGSPQTTESEPLDPEPRDLNF